MIDSKFFCEKHKKFRIKIPYGYRKMLKNKIISLSCDVNDHV